MPLRVIYVVPKEIHKTLRKGQKTMLTTKFGIEIEMTGITREQAAKVVAEHLNGTYSEAGTYYDIKKVTAPDSRAWKIMSDGSITSQTDMERIRDQLVEELQFCGIIEKFASPFRPWLQVGDVAVVTGGSSPRIVGIITDIQHAFGKDGFFSHFTVTSGGKISNPDNPVTVATRYAGKLGAANRKRRLLDYIQISKAK